MRTAAFFDFMLIAAMVLLVVYYNTTHTEKVKTTLEQAYFEGQKDALKGDVRITKNGDNCWIWTKSCWDNGEQPKFNPSVVCDGNK